MIERDIFLRGLSIIHSPSMLSIDEATFLYEFAQSFDRPITWVELGVWCGRGYWSAGCGLPDGSTLIGVDEFSGRLPVREGSDVIADFAHGQMQLAMFRAVESSVRLQCELWQHLYCETTHYASELWDIDERGSCIDVLVVDAAHDYESVKQDLADWLPKMRPGGTVLCHDFTAKHPGVVRAIQESLLDGKFNGATYQLPPQTRFCRMQVPA